MVLLGLFWLAYQPARAQTRPAAPAPPPAEKPQQVLTLRVTLPTVVGYALRAFGKDEPTAKPAEKSAPRTSNPVLVFTVPLPQLLSGKNPAPAPRAE